jgi:hypothetical protein
VVLSNEKIEARNQALGLSSRLCNNHINLADDLALYKASSKPVPLHYLPIIWFYSDLKRAYALDKFLDQGSAAIEKMQKELNLMKSTGKQRNSEMSLNH